MPGPEKPGNSPGQTPAPAGPSGLRRRWLLNAGLLALIGLLAWFAFQRGERDDAAGPPLTTLAADTVTQLRIERPGQEAIALEKTGDRWMLTAPVRARANAFNVDNLLRLPAAPGATRFPAEGQDLAKFGLDRPQARVRLDDREIALGTLHPLNDRLYVLHADEIVLIPAHYLSGALYPYANFIDSRLFEEQRRITAIRLPGFTVTQTDGAWQRQPPDGQLTSDRLNAFAAEWQNARALGVEKYSGKMVLDRIEVVSVHDGKDEKLALGILAYKPEFVLYRRDENLEYHFTEDTGKRLLNLNPE